MPKFLDLKQLSIWFHSIKLDEGHFFWNVLPSLSLIHVLTALSRSFTYTQTHTHKHIAPATLTVCYFLYAWGSWSWRGRLTKIRKEKQALKIHLFCPPSLAIINSVCPDLFLLLLGVGFFSQSSSGILSEFAHSCLLHRCLILLLLLLLLLLPPRYHFSSLALFPFFLFSLTITVRFALLFLHTHTHTHSIRALLNPTHLLLDILIVHCLWVLLRTLNTSRFSV